MSDETISIAEALELAIRHHRNGQLLEAENIYQKILEVDPREPNALHFLGVLSHQLGRADRAVELIKRSLEIEPRHAGAHNNLGNIYRQQSRWEEAEDAYRNALACDNELADAHHNLGNLLRRRGQSEQALDHFHQAVAVDPDASLCRIDLVDTLTGLRRADRTEEAAAVVRTWLAHDPRHPGANHLLAALTGEKIPARASDEHVRQMFDNFADDFDDRLTGLNYRAPERLRDAVVDYVAPSGNQVLDLGCGTGLCGIWLKPLAKRLVGVDLSPNMLRKAEARGLYDELRESELAHWMESQATKYDLIVACDTLNYFGDLAGVFSVVSNRLCDDGVFAFTIELGTAASNDGGFHLEPHGRYSHCPSNVSRLLETKGMKVIESEPAELRVELGEPVLGQVFTSRKTGGSD